MCWDIMQPLKWLQQAVYKLSQEHYVVPKTKTCSKNDGDM